MQERDLRALIERVREGKLERRAFIHRLVGLGLTAPMASMMLMHEGLAQTTPTIPYKPTKRGGGGTLRLLWWQGPVHLNPQWATGTKEQEGSRIFYEPLAAWDNDGNLFPVLAAELPSTQNGGVSADGKVVTWKLKQGVTWHDGQPFSADDVVFNWEFIKDPATASSLISVYKDIKVERSTPIPCASPSRSRRRFGPNPSSAPTA